MTREEEKDLSVNICGVHDIKAHYYSKVSRSIIVYTTISRVSVMRLSGSSRGSEFQCCASPSHHDCGTNLLHIW
ncbi:hypothetical protein PM082_018910 [Marasmius tenuissimus]|nr:hypothetical protein PM082_018910 [Marasmius tenuissimus]